MKKKKDQKQERTKPGWQEYFNAGVDQEVRVEDSSKRRGHHCSDLLRTLVPGVTGQGQNKQDVQGASFLHHSFACSGLTLEHCPCEKGK